MRKKPLVSVIMNCHNGEKFLSHALDSLNSQTYNNWELIFFDNRSTDKSKVIVKRNKNKKIRYFFSKKKLKLYDARNSAIMKARGQYITFLDTDDVWHKEKLKNQIKFLRINKNIKFLYSNFYIINNNKKNNKIGYKKNLPSGNISQHLLNEYVIGILTVMMERKFFKKVKFNSRYDIIGDFDLFFKLSIENEIGIIQKPLAYYRIHENNYSKKFDVYLNELNKWFELNKAYCDKKGLSLVKFRLMILKLKIKNFLSIFGLKIN